MKIGDRIFVRGYIDEIRKDTVIVRNDGGYFGTIPSEVITGELPSAQPEIMRCKDCKWFGDIGCARHYGRILTWKDCPYTCEYATAMRCSTEAKGESDGRKHDSGSHTDADRRD